LIPLNRAFEIDNIKDEYTLSNFEIIDETLGTGSFGIVKLVRLKSSMKLIALKCLEKKQIQSKKHV